MKKLILGVITLIFLIQGLQAQDDQSINSKSDNKITSNEVKLNALYLVLGAIDLNYEYLLNEESGLGVDVFVPFDDDASVTFNYYISPYYRLYFGKKYAAGFFLEGFGMLNSYDQRTITFTTDTGFGSDERSYTNFALGVGLGGKWLTKSGFIGELNIGVGRNFLRSKFDDYDFVGKLGISIGYRF